MTKDYFDALEEQIKGYEHRITQIARAEYPDSWIACRRILLGIMNRLQSYKAGVPGCTSPDIAEKLVLIAAYTQGVFATERLVSSGQYIKAAAVIKQELEMVVRLEEIKAGTAKVGKTPNMKYAPEGGKKAYGLLNNIAHPSRPDHLKESTREHSAGMIRGTSAVPIYNPKAANALFLIHISLMRDIAYHQILLAAEMYDRHDPEIQLSADEHEEAQALFLLEDGDIPRSAEH